MREDATGEGDLVPTAQLIHHRSLRVRAGVVVEVVAVGAVTLSHQPRAGTAHVAADVDTSLQELASGGDGDVTLVGVADGHLHAVPAHYLDLQVAAD